MSDIRRQWDAIAKRLDKRLDDKTNKLMRGVMLGIAADVIKDTPVDTGRARSNWNVSTSRPNLATTETIVSEFAKQREAKEFTMSVDFWNGEVGYVANGLPYIVPLEEGSSQQQPKGWVRRAVQRAEKQIEKAKVADRA